jgi:hypothetical protein
MKTQSNCLEALPLAIPELDKHICQPCTTTTTTKTTTTTTTTTTYKLGHATATGGRAVSVIGLLAYGPILIRK